MRILITGAGGFVGPHLVRELTARFGSGAVIIPTSQRGGGRHGIGDMPVLDVTDEAAVDHAVRELAPTHVVHLAAISSPAEAGVDATAAWRVNTLGTLAVARAIIRRAAHCWMIFAGSGLAYGNSAKCGKPLGETALLSPSGDYAATKAAADLALGALTGQGLRSIRLRLFNNTGPAQKEAFVVPGFAAQIARIEAGLQAPVMGVGNLDAVRDFLDVRDVAAAFALCIDRAAELRPGVIINIASGVPRSIRSVLNGLLTLSQVPIDCKTDPARLRPSELPIFVGDPTLARQLLAWQPQHRFGDTLASVLADWRAAIAEKTPARPQTMP
jgi:GDP-4-dehydro-6-deoxy-D-mannose reductase